jgi:hypothetical protein
MPQDRRDQVMNHLKPAYVYLATGVALILGGFYWFEWRPERIRTLCAMNLIHDQYAQNGSGGFDIKYWTDVCVQAGGSENFYEARDEGVKQGKSNEAKDSQ